MEEVTIEFFYDGKSFGIKSMKNEYMKDIINRFCLNIEKEARGLYFLYEGNVIDTKLKLEEINNNQDKMTILVHEVNEDENEMEEIMETAKNIICPKCGENCILTLDNYKINLDDCDNGHSFHDILLSDYNATQTINQLKIKCKNCKQNKTEVYNNKFFICGNCGINLCPICRAYHCKEHIILDYEQKNYCCKEHGERFKSFCVECHKNICDFCELHHDKNHKFIYHRDIIQTKEENINKLKSKIDDFKNEVNILIEKLNKVVQNMEIYYNINKNLSENELRNKNYQILMNINKLYNYNKNIINDIDLFLNENKIENKFLIIAKLDEIMSSKNIKENLYTKLNKENKEIIFSTPNKPISQAITPNNVHIIEHNVSLYINESKQSNFIRDYTVIEEKLFNGGKYIGEIRNEKREGKGKMLYNDGSTYEGEYKNDLRNGYGIFNIKQDNRYEGYFRDNKYDGKGTMYYINGDKYEGYWFNDKRDGKGSMYYKINNSKYEGDWKNDIRDGKGIFYIDSGDKYEGSWKNDTYEGKGIYYFNNGSRYEGDWEKGQTNGKGVFFYANGDIEIGNYSNGKKVGVHAYIYSNGKYQQKKYK